MDAFINARLAELAACLCAQIDGGDSMCFCGVMPGEQWYDLTGECEDDQCGQAWVRVVNVYPSTVLGVPDTSFQNCGKALSFDLEMGVIRCWHIPDGGEAPDAAQLLSASDQQVKDMIDMRKAIECCESFEDYTLTVWSPIGPSGGIYGGLWNLTVGVI